MDPHKLAMPARRANALSVAVILTLLTSCGQALPATTASGGERAPVKANSPLPTIEPTCAADYPHYGSLADVIGVADLIVRVTATGPVRTYEVETGLPSDADVPTVLDTAFTVEVSEVIKGDVAVGDVFEVSQVACTARPLVTGPDADYVLVLSVYDPGTPVSQINDSQAAWQVRANRSLEAVSPLNDLNVNNVDDLAAAVAAA